MTDTIEKVHILLGPLLEGTDMFIVDIKMKPVNNIKVYLDADGGLSIEKSSGVNRKLYAQIEAEQWFPDGDFSLEVSSPGVDEPLLHHRQYTKNIGRKVQVTLNDGKEKTGMLREVNEDGMMIEEQLPAKHKKETISTVIPFTDIKKTVVQIIF